MKKNPNFLGVGRGVWAGVLIGFGVTSWFIDNEVVGIISFASGLILWYLPTTSDKE